jgi:hypothetical protein
MCLTEDRNANDDCSDSLDCFEKNPFLFLRLLRQCLDILSYVTVFIL